MRTEEGAAALGVEQGRRQAGKGLQRAAVPATSAVLRRPEEALAAAGEGGAGQWPVELWRLERSRGRGRRLPPDSRLRVTP